MPQASAQKANKYSEIIDTFISHLQADKLSFEEGVQRPETQRFYDLFMGTDQKNAVSDGISRLTESYVPFLLKEYFSHLRPFLNQIEKIALAFSGTTLSVWAVVADEEIEAKL